MLAGADDAQLRAAEAALLPAAAASWRRAMRWRADAAGGEASGGAAAAGGGDAGGGSSLDDIRCDDRSSDGDSCSSGEDGDEGGAAAPASARAGWVELVAEPALEAAAAAGARGRPVDGALRLGLLAHAAQRRAAYESALASARSDGRAA